MNSNRLEDIDYIMKYSDYLSYSEEELENMTNEEFRKAIDEACRIEELIDIECEMMSCDF